MQTAGITIEHNAKGVPTFARIDLKKYGKELKEFLSAKGISIEESPYNQEFVAKIKQSKEQIRNGEYQIIKTENLWK
jgi:anti-sigma28 factor (negative regulator of flagellin synthesis)